MADKKEVIVVELADTVITPEQAREKARMLRAVVMDAIQPTAVRDMMRSLMGRAERGDHKAVETVLRLIGVDEPEPTEGDARGRGSVVQVVNVDARGAGAELSVDRQVLQALAGGPTEPAKLEDRLNLPPGTIEALIVSGLVKAVSGGVALTAAGKRQARAVS